MDSKRIAMFAINFNIAIAIGILLIGGTSHFLFPKILLSLSMQLLLVFSVGFLLCYMFSYCYVLTHSIETHFIGNILYEMKFAEWIHDNIVRSVFFVLAVTLLLWVPVGLFCLNITGLSQNVLFLVVEAIAWVTFVRAVDYAEQKSKIYDSREYNNVRVYVLLAFLFVLFGYELLLFLIELIKNKFVFGDITITNPILREIMLSVCGILFIVFAGWLHYRNDKKTKVMLERMNLQHQIEQGELYIQLMSVKYRTLQQYSHDYKKHLAYIQKLAQNNESKQIDTYISTIYNDLGNHLLLRLTGNKTIDLILSETVHQAEEKGIKFNVDYQLLNSVLDVTASDLSVVLGNMCDNAVKAAEHSAKKEVSLSFYSYNPYYCIVELRNSCDTEPIMKNGIPVASTIVEGHGFGVQNIIATVKKYGSECLFSYDASQKIFTLKVLLPCVDNRNEV
ncbi:MAG: GHKL domain-containing protein [Peptococcaceae bacterium]|nr:GHKL domain-containing protein [Peptococcaceae bacterium]